MSTDSYYYYLRLLNLPRGAQEADVRAAVTKELRVLTQRTNSPRLEQRQEAERMIETFETAEKVLLGPEGKIIRSQRGGAANEVTSTYLEEEVEPEAIARAIEQLALACGRKAQDRQMTVLTKRATVFHNGVEYLYQELVYKKYEAAQDTTVCSAKRQGLVLFEWHGIVSGNGKKGDVKIFVHGPWIPDLIATAAALESA